MEALLIAVIIIAVVVGGVLFVSRFERAIGKTFGFLMFALIAYFGLWALVGGVGNNSVILILIGFVVTAFAGFGLWGLFTEDD